jgi:hypothetical protein
MPSACKPETTRITTRKVIIMTYFIQFSELDMRYEDYQSLEEYEYRVFTPEELVHVIDEVVAMGYDWGRIAYLFPVAA